MIAGSRAGVAAAACRRLPASAEARPRPRRHRCVKQLAPRRHAAVRSPQCPPPGTLRGAQVCACRRPRVNRPLRRARPVYSRRLTDSSVSPRGGREPCSTWSSWEGGSRGHRCARDRASRRPDAGRGGARPPRRPHLDRALGRARHRAGRRLGALAPAAHVVRDRAGRARGRDRPGDGAGRVVRRRRAPHRHDRRARRHRRARVERVRLGRRGGAPAPARPARAHRRAWRGSIGCRSSSGSTSWS